MATSTAVTTRSNALPAPLTEGLQSVMPRCQELLPKDVPQSAFRAALYLHLQDPKVQLRECHAASVLDCTIKAAMDGLLPGRDCYFLPFSDKGVKKATYVADYRGLIRILERSGKVAKAFAHPVYSNDHFEVDYLSDTFSHKPALDHSRSSLRCFYGCVVLKDGTRHIEVLTLDEVEATKRRSRGGEQGPWVTDYVMMGRKTAMKRVCKYVQLAQRFAEEMEEDEAPVVLEREQIQENVSVLFGGGEAPLVVDHTTGELPPTAPNAEMVRAAVRALWEHLPAEFKRKHQKAMVNQQTTLFELEGILDEARDLVNAQAARQPGEEG